MIRGNLSDISIIDLTYIMHKHKIDNKLYDAHFISVATEIKEFINSIMINGYHNKKTQSILNQKISEK